MLAEVLFGRGNAANSYEQTNSQAMEFLLFYPRNLFLLPVHGTGEVGVGQVMMMNAVCGMMFNLSTQLPNNNNLATKREKKTKPVFGFQEEQAFTGTPK